MSAVQTSAISCNLLSAKCIDDLNAIRKSLRISIEAVALDVGMSTRNLNYNFSGRVTPRPATVAKIRRALLRLSGKRASPDLLAGCYGGFLALVAPEFGVTADTVRAMPDNEKTSDKTWLACSLARRVTIYLLNTELSISQVRLATLLGQTPAAICIALRAIEDRRDDPAFDRLLCRIAKQVTGGSSW